MDSKLDKTTREGGREGAKPLTSGFPRAATPADRNSSGTASFAANILDLRQKVNYILEVLASMELLPPEIREEVDSVRQRGFRRGR